MMEYGTRIGTRIEQAYGINDRAGYGTVLEQKKVRNTTVGLVE